MAQLFQGKLCKFNSFHTRWKVLNELLQDLSWIVTIRVDGSGFLLQGFHVNYTSASTVGVDITPTRTIFTLDAGPVRVNLTYLSPIEVIHFLFHLETYT
jgi:hypothetical protein